MRRLTSLLLLLWLALGVGPLQLQAAEVQSAEARVVQLEKPLYNPFVERYVLDELKSLRTDLQGLRAEFAEKFAGSQLQSADRAILYTTSTVNNIFYVIAAAASILALVGWSSLRDIRHRLNEVVESKVVEITTDYEKRLYVLEQKLKDRTERIISAQEEISRTNTLHALWMRAGLEATPQARIEVYDQILALNPDDIEALTYKADVVLELGEPEWALNLCDKALSFNPDYAYAHYQRACANGTLGQLEQAAQELMRAVELSGTYLEEARGDPSLQHLRDSGLIDHLLHKETV
ncbi:MAG: tetratricopeptide repeat protein [Gammaproteobacteria bacterium]|nr:tetratricopeptide repeat protein [Gammaproteobacteria bacterium]